MRNLIKELFHFLPLSLVFQSTYAQMQINLHFHGVTKNADDFSPTWFITSNPDYSDMIGTYQSNEQLLEPFYFTSYLFSASSTLGKIASNTKTAATNCTIANGTLKILYPIPSDAFYFYVLDGEYCVDKGMLQITHFNCSANQIREINTISASEFTVGGQEMNDTSWTALPESNYGKTDVILPFYNKANDYFSLARAQITLKDNGAPLQIHITSAVYDFNLEQSRVANAWFDLSTLANDSLIQWQYTAPYLIVGILPFGGKTITLNLYAQGLLTEQANVTLTESSNQLFYDMSLHPYNASAFLLYSQVIDPYQSPLPFLFQLHVISINGKHELLGSKPTNGIAALLTLQNNHGPYLRGGVFSLENSEDISRPNLTYFYPNHRQLSYSLPDFPWWLLAGMADGIAMVESADALHLVEMQKLRILGFELGSYDFRWPQLETVPSPTSQQITTNHLENTTFLENSTTADTGYFTFNTTNRSSFFQTASASTRSEPNPNYALIIGLSVGFLLLLASSITCCFVLCYKKKAPEPASKEEAMYSV